MAILLDQIIKRVQNVWCERFYAHYWEQNFVPKLDTNLKVCNARLHGRPHYTKTNILPIFRLNASISKSLNIIERCLWVIACKQLHHYAVTDCGQVERGHVLNEDFQTVLLEQLQGRLGAAFKQ